MTFIKIVSRVKRRKEQLDTYYNRLIRQIEAGELGGEADREFLDQFAVGQGLDLCCGDFLIGDSVGIDMDPAKIGSSWFHIPADKLTNFENNSLDFVVSNYILDVTSNTLEVLRNIHRVLKPNGTFAIVCRDADSLYYEKSPLGPLSNHHRCNLFTETTIKYYLLRTNFKEIKIQSGPETSLWINCLKN